MNNLESIMVRAYASVFTKAELEGLIAMFETPLCRQTYIQILRVSKEMAGRSA